LRGTRILLFVASDGGIRASEKAPKLMKVPQMKPSSLLLLLIITAWSALAGCGDSDAPLPTAGTSSGEEPCAERNPLRNLYFTDLHVHTMYSFDAYIWGTRPTPSQAYRFARGEPLALPPYDSTENGGRQVRLERSLDFAAVTDHSEFLGEIETCTTPGSPTYD